MPLFWAASNAGSSGSPALLVAGFAAGAAAAGLAAAGAAGFAAAAAVLAAAGFAGAAGFEASVPTAFTLACPKIESTTANIQR